MVRICDYSSLIFAGNTTVLLILSLTTDYWEYRTFDNSKIVEALAISNRTKLVLPFDTTSYVQIRITLPMRRPESKQNMQEETFYHPPLFVKKVYVDMSNKSNGASGHVTGSETGTGNQSNTFWEVHSEVNLFLQYGNLFRDCDALEAEVRLRLGFGKKRKSKCMYFDSARETSTVYSYAPELPHLETSACACALLCIVAIVIGSFSGGYALLSRYTCYRAYKFASCFSLTAGFFLTLGIALFHGKCHILRKMEILPGEDLPFKKMLNDSRTYSYGWSFSLAWICVFFCYTSSYVWLSKSQGSGKARSVTIRTRTRRKWMGKRLYYQCEGEDITTV